MHTILVTGADGFAGEHLCGRLAARNHRVIGIGLRALPPPRGWQYTILDMLDADRLNTLVADVRPDLVFHMAAIASTRIAERSLHHAARLNTLAVVDLMHSCAAAAPGCRVCIFSTGEVYGPNADAARPHTEATPFADPRNFYTATKIAQESYARILARNLGLPLVIIRPFSMTGPGQGENFVLGSWAAQVARIKRGVVAPEIRVGNLDVYRDFTDVRDAMRGTALLAELEVPAGTTAVYNIASGRAYHLAALLGTLTGMAGVPVTVTPDPSRMRAADYPVFVGSAAKIQAACGWRPEIPIERTLAEMVETCQRNTTG
jgi:GDP-4-dehydro-6-deoxy-D-mannose reductase